MRKIFLLLAAIVSLNLFATEGALNGRFTIDSEGHLIVFSKGNLQYVGTWQFAEHQWDTIGAGQADDHRDLFGWGTGDAPNKVSREYNDYATFTDWGVNPITNGGNEANAWRTLTKDEWVYLFYTRENAATLFALGSVNGQNGLILLPDNWELPDGASFTASTTQGLADQGTYFWDESSTSHWTDNTYTAEQWAVMESAGAVFLPAAGVMGLLGAGFFSKNPGYYWSATATASSDRAYFFNFDPQYVEPQPYGTRYLLQAVRLVQAAIPFASVVSAPTAIEGLIYNGSAQTLINAGEAEGGEMQYSLDNTNWSAELPTATAMGVYNVYYKVVADASHSNSRVFGPIVAKIHRAEPLQGKFSISDTQKIRFAQGNLQYVGSTWMFADFQWEFFGDAQSDNHRDLFGWGTGDAPNKVSGNPDDYTDFHEWGANAICNGGNADSLWRTLTHDEWHYLLNTRTNAYKLQNLGSVNGVNGLIILPDDWELPEGVSFTSCEESGESGNSISYSDNTYTAEQWAVMETAGAVFLPAAGYRVGSDVDDVDEKGYYWSATPATDAAAYNGYFNSYYLGTSYKAQYCGSSVRLVQDVESEEGIESVNGEPKAVKFVRDGMLYIERNGRIYNATGAEVR